MGGCGIQYFLNYIIVFKASGISVNLSRPIKEVENWKITSRKWIS